MKKPVENPCEITEEGDEDSLYSINTEVQKKRIRGIINYQKSLYFSSSSSSSSSSATSCSTYSSSTRSSLLELMKGGSASLRRLFDMERTSLSKHFNEYSGSPVIKPILLWNSDMDDGTLGLSPWTDVKQFIETKHDIESEELSGFASESSYAKGKSGFEKKQHIRNKKKLIRSKSFRRLPEFGIWRCRGFRFRLKLRRLRIMICGRKF